MMSRKSILWVLIIAATAACLIFVLKSEIPLDLTRDEIEFARFSMLLSNMSYTPYDPYATGHATLYFYIILGAFKLFGLTQEALRLPSAVFGVLGSVGIYFLLNQVWQDTKLRVKIPTFKKDLSFQLAGIGALIFATQRWYYNFARYSFEATFLIFLEVVSLGSMYAFSRARKMHWLVTSAVFAGLAYNSYQPGRLFVVVPLILLLLQSRIRCVKNTLMYCAVVFIMIAPITVYFMQHQDTRLQQQLYFADPNLTSIEKLQFLGSNILATKLMFFAKGDVSGLHNYPYKPAITIVMSIALLGGVVRAVKNYTNKDNLVFIMYALVALVPTLLTYTHENPNMLRTVTFLVPMTYFIGYGVIGLQKYLEKLKERKALTSYVGTIVIGLFVLSAVLDARTYFVFQRKVFSESFEIKDGFAGVYVFMRENDIPLGDLKLPSHEYDRFNELIK